MKQPSVVYINFSQYDNTGRILDYLMETFPIVIHLSFDHLRLKHGRKMNLLSIYKKKRLTKRVKLYSFRVPAFLLFPSLPIVATLMIIQSVYHVMRLRKVASRPIFFTVNAYPALIGILLKKLGLISSVYYWVWDFYPTSIMNWHMKIIRYCYLLFDTIAVHKSGHLIFPNTRQLIQRNAIKKIRDNFRIIPLGCGKPIDHLPTRSSIIGFLGMLKDSQGIQMVIENMNNIITKNPSLRIEIIGSGPEEEYLRHLAKPFRRYIRFYGFIDNQRKIERIIRRWSLGLALYEPHKSNESYFGDPSKIKVYLSQGVPILTTNVTEYGILAKKYMFGMNISYNPAILPTAIRLALRRQNRMAKNAQKFAKQFYYRTLYKPMFQSLPSS